MGQAGEGTKTWTVSSTVLSGSPDGSVDSNQQGTSAKFEINVDSQSEILLDSSEDSPAKTPQESTIKESSMLEPGAGGTQGTPEESSHNWHAPVEFHRDSTERTPVDSDGVKAIKPPSEIEQNTVIGTDVHD